MRSSAKVGTTAKLLAVAVIILAAAMAMPLAVTTNAQPYPPEPAAVQPAVSGDGLMSFTAGQTIDESAADAFDGLFVEAGFGADTLVRLDEATPRGNNYASQSTCTDIIVNGGFEEGPSVGWGFESNALIDGSPATIDQVILNASLDPDFNAAEGDWFALVGRGTNIWMNLTQTDTLKAVDPSRIESATLRYILAMVTEETPNTVTDDWFAPFIGDNAGNYSPTLLPRSVFSEESGGDSGTYYELNLDATDLMTGRLNYEDLMLVLRTAQNDVFASLFALDGVQLNVCVLDEPQKDEVPADGIEVLMGQDLDLAACTIEPGAYYETGVMSLCNIIKHTDLNLGTRIRYHWRVDGEPIPALSLARTQAITQSTGCLGSCVIYRSEDVEEPLPEGLWGVDVWAGDIELGTEPGWGAEALIAAEPPVTPTPTEAPQQDIFLPYTANGHVFYTPAPPPTDEPEEPEETPEPTHTPEPEPTEGL